MKEKITVAVTINAPVSKVWVMFTQVEHILNWNFETGVWKTTKALNDLRVGGICNYSITFNDSNTTFESIGVYNVVNLNNEIGLKISNNRSVNIIFNYLGDSTEVVEIFDADDEQTIESQQVSWQSILNNFKEYVETSI